jgi:hypothetical protein
MWRLVIEMIWTLMMLLCADRLRVWLPIGRSLEGTLMRRIYGMMIYTGLMLLVLGAFGTSAVDSGGAGVPLEDRGIARSLVGDAPYAGAAEGGRLSGGFDGERCQVGPRFLFAAKGSDDQALGVVMHNWRGFALNGSESHALRVSLESMRPIEPMNVRKLLATNMSIEQVRERVRQEEGDVTQQGVMKLGDQIYRLVNISMTQSGNYTELESDLGELRWRAPENGTKAVSSNASLGHLSVRLYPEDSAEVSKGALKVERGKYAGEYEVLLDAQEMRMPPPPEGPPPEGQG